MDYRTILLHLAIVTINSLDEETKQAGREMVNTNLQAGRRMINTNLQFLFRSLTIADREAGELPVALEILNDGNHPVDIEMGLVPVADAFVVPQEAVEFTFYDELFESDFFRWVKEKLGLEVVATAGSIILILRLTSKNAEDDNYVTNIIKEISKHCYEVLRAKMSKEQAIHCKLETDPALIANKLFHIALEAQNHYDSVSHISYKHTEVTATNSSRRFSTMVKNHEKKVEELTKSHDYLSHTVANLVCQLKELKDSVENQKAAFVVMQSEYDERTFELESRVEELESKVEDVETNLEDLDAKVDELDTEVDERR